MPVLVQPPGSEVYLGYTFDKHSLSEAWDVLHKIPHFSDREDLLRYCLKHYPFIKGSFLELGVYSGFTINLMAITRPDLAFYGFDSFEGLPDNWDIGKTAEVPHSKGHFKCVPPPVMPNVQLIKGWFKDTIPVWLTKHQEPVAFVHVDCDLYISTIQALTILDNYIKPGTFLIFDEMYDANNKKSVIKEHEWKAFTEWVINTNRKFRVSYRALDHQASIIIVQ
jgi:hypothetical protein